MGAQSGIGDYLQTQVVHIRYILSFTCQSSVKEREKKFHKVLVLIVLLCPFSALESYIVVYSDSLDLSSVKVSQTLCVYVSVCVVLL